MNRFQEVLKRGKVTGIFLNEPSTASVQMIGEAGLDYVCIDCEHRLGGLAMTSEQIASLCYAAHSVPKFSCLVRVPDASPQTMRQYAQTAADGLIVPQVNSVQQALDAFRATRFARDGGSRGISGQQEGNSFAFQEWNFPVVIPQLESVDAEKCVAGLAAIPGIDVWFVGPADFKESCLAENRSLSPETINVRIATMADVVKKAGKNIGIMQPDPKAAKILLDSGEYNMVAIGTASLAFKNWLIATRSALSGD